MLLLALWMATVNPPHAFLEQWVKAQNAGDFAAYEKLYARRFTGIRRSGPRVVRLDRAGWMRDRRRMFKRPMVVSVADESVAPIGQGSSAGGGAIVTFVQTWSAPESGYADEGRKTMVLMSENGALRIVREEMLESEIVSETARNGTIVMKDVKITLGSSPDGGARSSPEAGPDGGAPQHQTITIGRLEVKVVPAAPEEGSFAFVFEGNVVLSTDASDAWVTGRPARKSTTSGMGEEIVRRVDAAKLPNSLRGWKGRTVKLYDFDGPVCTTRITGFQQMRRVIPHFSETSGWSEQRASESRIARELWDEAGGSDLLLGTVADESTCARATWARLPSFRTPKLTSPETADDALAARALGAFRKLDAWQKIQADFRSETGEKTGQWDLYDGAHPTVNRLGRLVYVSAAAGNGCGEFGANLFALWELVGGKLVPRNKPGDFFLDPRAAVDLDGDGVPEILIDEGIVRRSGDFYSNPENLYVPNHDCPC